MAGYSTYRKSSASRSSYKRSRSYGSLKSRTKANFKSAKKGNDSLSFVVNSNYVFSARYDSSDNTGTAVVNVWEVLCRNSNFDLMKRMYDQVRIDGIKYKLNVTDAVTTINEINQVKNYTIYTAWDKTGLSQGQYKVGTADGDGGWDEVDPSDWDDRDKPIGVWWCTIGSAIVNNSTAQKSILSSFQRWNAYGSCYPYLLNEKSQYIQTSDINLFNDELDQNNGFYELKERYGDECMNAIVASPNPVIPFESTSCRFKPCLLVGVFSNSVTNDGKITLYGDVAHPVIFNAEFSISLTFRNLKGTSDTNVSGEIIPQPSNPNVAPSVNPVTVRPTEQQMDNAMNVDETNNGPVIPRPQPNMRSLFKDYVTRDGVEYGRIVIDNFNSNTNNMIVSSNRPTANYCTSLTIELPAEEEVTPLDIKGIAIPKSSWKPKDGSLESGQEVIDDLDDYLFIGWNDAVWYKSQPVSIQPQSNMRVTLKPKTKVDIPAGDAAVIIEEVDVDGETTDTAPESTTETPDKKVYVVTNDGPSPKTVTFWGNVKYTLGSIAASAKIGVEVVVNVVNFGVCCWKAYKFVHGLIAPSYTTNACTDIVKYVGNRSRAITRDGEPSEEPNENEGEVQDDTVEMPFNDLRIGLVLDHGLYKFVDYEPAN